MRSIAAVLLTIAWASPRAVTAQTQLEVAPYVGRYQPTTILGSGDGVPADAGDTVKHLGSGMWGIRVTRWGSGRLGVEASVGYAPSSLWSSSASTVYRAHVLTVSAKALMRVPLPAVRAVLHVGGGLGAVGHGSAFDGAYPNWYSGPRTFLGLIANLGGVINLVGPVGVRFDAEDFVFPTHLGPCTRSGPASGSVCDVFGNSAGRTTGSRLQNDIVLSLGLALAARR
jgi:hypothetical protein